MTTAGAALADPAPPLADELVALRSWSQDDLPLLAAAAADEYVALGARAGDGDRSGSRRPCIRGTRPRSTCSNRVGFLREGRLRAYTSHRGVREDALIYSLLPGELRRPG